VLDAKMETSMQQKIEEIPLSGTLGDEEYLENA
jgi:hypothetical protein